LIVLNVSRIAAKSSSSVLFYSICAFCVSKKFERMVYFSTVFGSIIIIVCFLIAVCPTLEACNGDTAHCNAENLPTSTPNITGKFLTTEAPSGLLLAAGSLPQEVVVVIAANDTVKRSNKTTSLKSKKATLPGECSDNVIMMLREENPTSVFDSSTSLAYQFIDTTIFVSRFDVDQFKDTGGTLTVTARASLKVNRHIMICRTRFRFMCYFFLTVVFRDFFPSFIHICKLVIKS